MKTVETEEKDEFFLQYFVDVLKYTATFLKVRPFFG